MTSLPQHWNRVSLAQWVAVEQDPETSMLRQAANHVRYETLGNKVWIRAIIEFSNICARDCHYCGIRRSNRRVKRYSMSREDILSLVDHAWRIGYRSIVLQSGEREDAEFTDFVTGVLREIHTRYGDEIGITLSLGEQTAAVCEQWRNAGAHRYLLRIETTNPELFGRLHPPAQSYQRRMDCLHTLKRLDYQTGTGVMIGLPGQTPEHLADDLLFFREMGIDMIGMGPYVEHEDTPAAHMTGLLPRQTRLHRAINMIALSRLLLPDINIAAATALQALDENARTDALRSGANVVMPVMTSLNVRGEYQLYQGKPGIDLEESESRLLIERMVADAGFTVGWQQRGDPKHYFSRKESQHGKSSSR